MKLKNVSPLGDIWLPLVGAEIPAGGVFEVTDEQGAALLDQVGNFAAVKEEKGKK